MMNSSTAFEGAKKSSAESPEAKGAVGELSSEQVAKLQVTIAEKTKLAEGLRKAGREKFEAFKQMKAEHDREQATLARLMLNEGSRGKMNLSESDVAASKRDSMEKLESAGREAANYRKDAEELEAEIEELKMRLENRDN